MIRYEIKREYAPANMDLAWMLLAGGWFICNGTWRDCAEKLRQLHPKAKIQLSQNLLVSNSVDNYLRAHRSAK
jgi:hypothetical protein